MHLQRLIAAAEDFGADRAAPVPAAAIVVDDRVNLKCRVPLCSGYGHNLMCPPSVMAAGETRDVLRKYDDALVVQLDIPVTQDCVDEQLGGRTYAEARSDADQIEGLRESQNRFAHLMTDLERMAVKLGYRYAALFSGGECVLCEECGCEASGKACRHPFRARPYM
jgi:predicted metal-binding protein